MATPLHHDQPHQSLRVLQSLKNNSKKHAENLIDADGVAWKFAFPQPNMPGVLPPQHQDNPSNQRDSQSRRGAQQLPPRPPLSPRQMQHRQQQQQFLRQRHQAEPSSADPLNEVRPLDKPRLSSPAWPYTAASLQGSGLDRPHPRKSSEDPKSTNSYYLRVESSVKGPYQDQMHHANGQEESSLQQRPDSHYSSSTGDNIMVAEQERSCSHSHQRTELHNEWGHRTPHADLVEAEKQQLAQKLASSSITSSHTRDYKAALTQNNLQEHTHSQQSLGQYIEHPSLQDAKEDYFGCKQDEKRQGQGQVSRLDRPALAEEKRQRCPDFSKMQYFDAEECPEISSGDDANALRPLKGHMPQYAEAAKQQHQTRSEFCLMVPSMEKYFSGDQVGDQGAVDHETSANNPQPECGTMIPSQNHESTSPQQLHDEQFESREASPDDSYFHVSKELVLRDYQNECHLATSSTNQQSCGHVYDYSRAGVTLVENNTKLANEPQLEKDECRDETGLPGESSESEECKDDGSYGEQLDAQNDAGVELQDVESPPLFLGFNQNSTCFACGTSKGFRVYNIDTMKECFSSMVGGVSLVEQLLSTNIFLLVGGGPNPSFPPNKVVLWDSFRGESCGERSQKYPILAVKARQDRLVVVVENEVFVYKHGNAKVLFQAITISNPRGLCAVSMNEGPSVLACPGLKKGEVRIEHVGTSRGREESQRRNSIFIPAHDSALACMALTLDGNLLATASDRGTLIRVFNTHDGTPLKEVRRGMDRAEIFSIAFSPSSDWLAVSSDKGTVHVFGLRPLTGPKTTETNHASSTTVLKNPGSTLSFIKGVLPKYFSSEWSAAQFKLPEEMKSVVAFGKEKHSIYILGTDGSFYKCSFNPELGGDMKQLEYSNFMKPKAAAA